VRNKHALHLQFAHSQEAIGADVAEVDDPRISVAAFTAGVSPFHRHTVANEAVKLPIVLDQRTREVDPGDLLNRLFAGHLRKVWIEHCERRTKVAHQHYFAVRRSAKGALRSKGLGLVSVDAFPAEPVAQMVRERLLDKTILAVDVGDHPASAPFPICFSKDWRTSPIT
jgi:hypothetical protein